MTAVAIPSLLYHAVAEDVDPRFAPWAITPALFARHMQLLADRGFSALTVSQFVDAHLAGGQPLRRPTVLITFDDGFADFHSTAHGVLRRHGFGATVYLTTGLVGGCSRWLDDVGEGERPMMSWDQIAEIAADGIECGAHTSTHVQLDVVSRRTARGEIRLSRAVLSEAVGPVRSFAYPHGYHSRRVRREVIDAGFDSACAVGEGPASLSDDRSRSGAPPSTRTPTSSGCSLRGRIATSPRSSPALPGAR